MRAGNGATQRYGASLPAIWSALLAVYLIWGSTYLAIRFAVETAPPLLSAAARFMISGAALYLWRRAAGDARPSLAEWRGATVIGVLLLVGGNGGVVWAAQFIPSGLTALLVATVPLWMVALDLVHGANRPGLRSVLGVLIGFGGVLVLIRAAAVDFGEFNLLGAAAVLLASLSWAAGSLYARGARLPASPLLGTAMEMVAGGVVLLLIGSALDEWGRFDIHAISQRSALAVAYLTVVGSSAFVAYAWLLRVAPTALVSTYAYVNPLVAVWLGYILAHEPVTARTLLAAGLIVGSVVLVSAPQR